MDQHTQVWLSNQAIWKDSDMIKIGLAGLSVGFVLGTLACLCRFL